MTKLSTMNSEDSAICARIAALEEVMQTRAIGWSQINTGSWNLPGLDQFAPKLAEAFSVLDAEVELQLTSPFETVNAAGKMEQYQTGPIIRISARPQAPVQIVMSGHYDTVFPLGTFDTITDLKDGRLNGPGLADMKGGLSVMLGALQAFEAGPLKQKLGYKIVITPDEEIGNFASAAALTEAAQSGAVVGMTY
ncbi:MAG: M20/M25/M40 family metallo-hydrolase [Henriciella sp.]|nr:M20/M25/M40 family metallo-hydrolase [Henriciella sp.]